MALGIDVTSAQSQRTEPLVRGAAALDQAFVAHYNKTLRNNPHDNTLLDNPSGPVGLLLHSLREVGACLSDDLKIKIKGEPDIDTWHMPSQHLKKSTTNMMANHRARNATASRSHLTGLEEIDAPISKEMISKLATKELKVYNHLASGGAWAEQHLQDIGLSNGRCKHCGANAEPSPM